MSHRLGEFELIERYCSRPSPGALLGIGDDAALLQPAPGQVLAVSSDMLVAGRHFFADVAPDRLGHKALAVNLSDLAAMGATPRWAVLAFALPEAEPAWLEGLMAGFFALAGRHGVDLVGGDTTRGPLNLCVTVLGEVPAGQALRRDAARAGDELWVSGTLGGAALALRHALGEVALDPATAARTRLCLELPEPRIALGLALRGLAHAAIDISDGLAADLGHILTRSGLGATLQWSCLPLEPALHGLDAALALRCGLAGGDDYELCFTAPAAQRAAITSLGERLGLPLTRIGRIEAKPGLRLIDAEGRVMSLPARGFDHFASAS